MDAPVNTTRRGLFAAGAGLTTLAVPLGHADATATLRISDAEFIRSIEALLGNGALAARQALAAGMKPAWLYCIVAPGSAISTETPALLFKDDAGNHHTFRPRGED